MANGPVRYLRPGLTLDSQLSFDDVKNLITSLAELTNSEFKLIIRSSGDTGLELFLGLDPSLIDQAKKYLYGISPKLVVTEVKRSQATVDKPNLNFNYHFKRHYAYPLLEPTKPDTDQALLKLLQHISQLDKRQTMTIELDAKANRTLKAKLLKKRLLSGASPRLNDSSPTGYLLTTAQISLGALTLVLKSALYLSQNLVYSKNPKELKNRDISIADPRSVIILDKLYEPLFKTRLNVKVKAASLKQADTLAKNLNLALNNFAKDSGYQLFKIRNNGSADIYSASDLAALYHYAKSPTSSSIYRLSQHKTLAPHSYDELSDGLTLGINSYQGRDHRISLSSDARERHLYIVGATGSGKSTLIANLVAQDIEKGQGISLIDPHGDLTVEVLKSLPKPRRKDVIYFEPSDQAQSLYINLLELKSKSGTPQYLSESDQVTESLISLFRKIFSTEDLASHRIEYILRNCIHTALDIEGSTIFTIFSLLTDPAFRLKIVPTIKDQSLVNFWRNELGRAGEYQRVKMSAGVTSKIGRFLFSEPSKRVFGQPKSTLDIDQIINNQKILICNFSKGSLGEDGSKLFSTAVLTKLQLAALNRATLKPDERLAHYLYVDEFQNYAPSVLIQMLSEARKYKLYLTMAEQSPSQQDSLSTSVILANVGNLLCFRTASPRDAKLLLPSFDGYLDASDLNNLPAYNFYLKSVAKEVKPPISGQTLPPETKVRPPYTKKPRSRPTLIRATA